MSHGHAADRHAHRTSDGSRSSPLSEASPLGTTHRSKPTPTATHSSRRTAAAANAAAKSSRYSTHRESTFSSRASISTGRTTSSAHPQSDSLTSSATTSPLSVPLVNRNIDRDSFVSIVDDPFFQRLDPGPGADTNTTSGATPVSSHIQPPINKNDSDKTQPRLYPRRESLTVGSFSSHEFRPSSTMESFNIAVIGADGVGKSTFIQTVLGLSRPPVTNSSSRRMHVDNVTHMITLLELDLDCFELNPSQPVQWPKQINGHIMPRVDAALALYDVTSDETVRDLPKAIAALTNSGLPAVLVACKTEQPEDEWEVDADEIANHQLFKPCIASYKVSMKKPDVANASLHHLIRAAVSQRRDESGASFSRRRAQSAANLEAPDPSGVRPISSNSKHSRASSDFSLLRGFQNSTGGDGHRAQASRSPRPGFRLDKPGSDSFLDVDESDVESHRYSDDIPILQRNEDSILDNKPKVIGVSFEDLVDRLLALRLSRADINFSDIFLCLYRKFATPGQLFAAILARLDRVRDDKTAHYLTKTATQLRIIEIVARWVSLYPGDFARPTTRRNLEDFINHLSTEPIFAIASQQMRRNLHFNVIEDDDTGWLNADDAEDEVGTKIPVGEIDNLSPGISVLHVDDDDNSEASLSGKGGGAGSQFQFHSFEECEREALTLEPTGLLPMNKDRYHNFLEIPDDEIADELVRIDWVMFSSIRVRDFVRHVNLSAAQKDQCKSLKNVNRMISHFNHIAKWVANLILLRDKAKHRAQMLEKFMIIALKLRQLNNYNGLAAVLAGITGTAIHRLAQTRALVPPETQKKFARLVILMGTQKSHFAYRLAWENSPLPRIPFIPLHRRDLVSAEEGSKTFVGPKGDRINWKKFEVLGEVLLPIMKSQGTAYSNLVRHERARELILDCRMPTDDEEIYQRSVELEGNLTGPADPSKKKFPWFAK